MESRPGAGEVSQRLSLADDAARVLAAVGSHSRLIEIPSADHFGTTVAKESIEAILALATAK